MLSMHDIRGYLIFILLLMCTHTGTTPHSEHVDLLYRVQGGTLPQESQLHIDWLPFISIIT